MNNSSINILIVEDSAIQAEKLRRILATEGYVVTVARDGAEGFSKASESRPDIVITDIMMPEMHGFDLCRLIKNSPELRTIPVVLLTSLSDPSDVISGLECGADNFIIKPYEEKMLLKRVRQLLLIREFQCEDLPQMGVEILFSGKKYFITSEKRQILDLLISTYESAVQKNSELIDAQEELQMLNDQLEQRVAERTEELTAEIERRKKTEEELRKTQALLQASLDQSSAGIAIADAPDGRLRYVNDAGLLIRGSNRQTVANGVGIDQYVSSWQLLDLDGRQLKADEVPLACAIKTGKNCSREFIIRRSEGDDRIVLANAAPIKDNDGNVEAAIVVFSDITESRKLELQLRQSQKMESIGILAGGIAHDFNNILSVIIGYGNIALMKMADDDPQRVNVQHMLAASERAALLTKDLLLFSRKQTSEKKPIDLNDVVIKIEKFLIKLIGEDIVYKTVLHGTAIPVSADEHQLEQVFMNLATNAAHAMPQGGGLVVTTTIVTLGEEFISTHGYGNPGSYALLTVEDTGIGMDENTLKQIFEPFFTTKEVGKGTGLGLAVVYGIIKQHEGYIIVSSKPGTGTTFRIYLPIVTAEQGETLKLEQGNETVGGNETLLLAEDDAMVRGLMKSVLTQYGYTVIEAIDGLDAISRFSENSDSIDLLLLDLIMPIINGKEAFDEIRKIRPEVKAIFSSGYTPDTLQQKVVLVEDACILAKPFSPDKLLQTIRTVLDGTN